MVCRPGQNWRRGCCPWRSMCSSWGMSSPSTLDHPCLKYVKTTFLVSPLESLFLCLRWCRRSTRRSLTLTALKGATCCWGSPTSDGITWGLQHRLILIHIARKRKNRAPKLTNIGGCWQVDRVGTFCSSAPNETDQKQRRVKLSQVRWWQSEICIDWNDDEQWRQCCHAILGRDPKGLYKNFNYHRFCLQWHTITRLVGLLFVFQPTVNLDSEPSH